MTRWGIALVVMVGVSVAGAAQTFKSHVDSVRLDALVLDRGRPVLGLTARQETASYRLDHGWLVKKFDSLNDSHKRTVLEIVHALLRLEGKQ